MIAVSDQLIDNIAADWENDRYLVTLGNGQDDTHVVFSAVRLRHFARAILKSVAPLTDGKPVAWRYWEDKWQDWEYTNTPNSPHNQPLQPLYGAQQNVGWRPISTASTTGREMIVVCAINTDVNERVHNYTTDPYCVWPDEMGGWARWPHPFPPTHWMPLPARNEQSVDIVNATNNENTAPPADEFAYLNAWMNTARQLNDPEGPLQEAMAARLMRISDVEPEPTLATFTASGNVTTASLDDEQVDQILFATGALRHSYASPDLIGYVVDANTLHAIVQKTVQSVQSSAAQNGWSVFNSGGAEVAGGLSQANAMNCLTPSRLERGWTAVCVINKDNPPADGTPGWQPHCETTVEDDQDARVAEVINKQWQDRVRDPSLGWSGKELAKTASLVIEVMLNHGAEAISFDGLGNNVNGMHLAVVLRATATELGTADPNWMQALSLARTALTKHGIDANIALYGLYERSIS